MLESPGFSIRIRVVPRAGRNACSLRPDGTLKVWVTAPPAEGEANAAVCETLAKALGIAKSRVEIARGAGSREKVISVEGLSRESAFAKLRK